MLAEYARLNQEEKNSNVEMFWQGVRLICWHIAHYAGKTLKDDASLKLSDIVQLPGDKVSIEKIYSEGQILTMIEQQWPQGG